MRQLIAVTLILGMAACSAPSVTVQPGAPLIPSDCNWPHDIELSFAGWSTLGELGLNGDDMIFALVTRHRVRVPVRGPEVVVSSRGLCGLYPDGATRFSAVPDNWQAPTSSNEA